MRVIGLAWPMSFFGEISRRFEFSKAKSGLFLNKIRKFVIIILQQDCNIILCYQNLDSMVAIGENTKQLRIKQGLSQDDLARKIEFKYSTLAKIDGDFVKKPGVQMVARIKH